MRRMLLASILALLPLHAHAFEAPQEVTDLEDGVYAICDRLTLTARWQHKPEEVQTRRVMSPCGTGFQVSDTELLTASHVPGFITAALFDPMSGFFTTYINIKQRHGYYTPRMIPVEELTITFHREVISVEGLTFSTPTISFTVPWQQAEPDSLRSLEAEFTAIFMAESEALQSVDYSSGDLTPVLSDTDRELALFRFHTPVIRSAYPIISERAFSLYDLSWGIGAREPGQFHDGTQTSLVSGSIRETDFVPEIEYWPLGEDVTTYRIMVDRINWPGVSGGPNLSRDGALIGVTHGSGGEHKMSFDLQFPCNERTATGLMFVCERYVIPGHIVHEFLLEARAQ